MEKQVSLLQSILPSLVRSCSDWLQFDVSVKLFGVKVFSFTWPPRVESSKIDEQ